MKTIKNLMTMAAVLLTIPCARAQSGAMKDPVTFKLKSGLTIIVAENGEATKVYSGFTTDARLNELVDKPGAQELLTIVLNAKLSGQDSLVSYSDKGGNINAEPADFEKALTLLSSTLIQPSINQTDLEDAKSKLVNSLKANDRYFPETINEAAVNALSIQDITTLYKAMMVPSTSFLTIVGNIKVADAKALAKQTMGNWKGGSIAEITK